MLSTLLDALFNRQESSRDQARERLRLVLAHDRSDLTPEAMTAMRNEILEVVSRYVELDMESLQFDVTCESGATALIANLPIRRIHPLTEDDWVTPSEVVDEGSARVSAKGTSDRSVETPDVQDSEVQDPNLTTAQSLPDEVSQHQDETSGTDPEPVG